MYYVLNVQAGQKVLLHLDDANDRGTNGLYVCLDDVPTQIAYDARSGDSQAADQAVQEYDLLIGVFGHGATNPEKGGDFHPDYALYVVPGVPSPDTDNGDKQQTCGSTTVLNAFDPNEKIGPAGVGTQHFVTTDSLMPYTIYFENEPDYATAAARRVLITDQLDEDLDWSTLQFQTIHFGERTLTVTDLQGPWHFEADTTVSYDDYPIHVTADFDLTRCQGQIGSSEDRLPLLQLLQFDDRHSLRR